MTTVLFIPGSFSFGNTATLQTAFGGGAGPLLTQLGDSSTPFVVNVPYNDWDTFNGYKDGAEKLNQAILDANPTDKIVAAGHSYGAVSICQWLREYGPTCSVDPSRLRFVLIGNSCRPGGTGGAPQGLCAQLNMYGGVGPDVTTRYNVIDAAREFDKWADWPNVWSSSTSWAAANNCNSGDSYPYNIHVSYQHINLTTPDAQVTQGNVTFMLFKTTPLPMSGITLSQISSAYNRVVGSVNF